MIASREYVIKRLVELITHPKKKYSQNFLTSFDIVKKAVDAIGDDKAIPVIEIGPGLGALTEEIIKRGFNLTAYEIDEVMCNHLKEVFKNNKNFTLIEGDFLKQNISFDGKLTVISNVPYQITTPIIEKVLTSNVEVNSFIFMLQKEAAMRIQAKKGSKDYAPLPIFLSYLGKFETVCKVGRESFIPSPNVDSIIIKFTILRERDYNLEKKLYQLLNNAFKMRRKTLANNLKSYFKNKDDLTNAFNNSNILLTARPEELQIDDYLNLLNEINKFKL